MHFRIYLCPFTNVFRDESLHQASVLVIVDQLKQQLTQSSMQREEIIRLKQELQLIHRDLLLSGPVRFDITNPHLALPVSLVMFMEIQVSPCYLLWPFTVQFSVFVKNNI